MKKKFTKKWKLLITAAIALGTLQIISINKMSDIHAVSSNTAAFSYWNEDIKTSLLPPVYSTNKYWTGSKIYWGKNYTSGNSTMGWNVLNTRERGLGTGEKDGLLMFYNESYGVGLTPFNLTSNPIDQYESSLLGTLLDNAVARSLSEKELAATLTTNEVNDKYSINGRAGTFEDNIINKKWFAPTVEMMTNVNYGFSDNSATSQTRYSQAKKYWLSSLFNSTSPCVSMVNGGDVSPTALKYASSETYAKPATQIDGDAILFITNADGGKSNAVFGENALKDVNNSPSGVYKLTLKDETQKISVNSAKIKNNIATIKFNKEGDGNIVSAIVTDSTGKKILSYGQIKDTLPGTQTNQTASVKLPAEFVENGYRLKIFTEIFNGDRKTDYASLDVDTNATVDTTEDVVKKLPNTMIWNDTTKADFTPAPYTTDKIRETKTIYWGGEPKNSLLRWEILNPKETSLDSTGSESVLMLTKQDFFRIPFDAGGDTSYNDSDLAIRLDELMEASFNSEQKAVTVDSGIENDEYYLPGSTSSYKDSFSGKKWFIPTAKMMANESYGFSYDTRQNRTRGYLNQCWTASTYTAEAKQKAIINSTNSSGMIHHTTATSTGYSSRLATQLKSDDILLISNSTTGKKSTSVGENSLAPVINCLDDYFKFTLKDPNQKITVHSAKVDMNNVANISYEKSGDGTFLSAIVTDSTGESIISYGNLKKNVAAGNAINQTATVKLPADFFEKGYRLKLFTETIASSRAFTDYGSEIVDTNAEKMTYLPNTMMWSETTKGSLNPPAFFANKTWEGSKLYWGSKGDNPLLWDVLNTKETSLDKDGKEGMLLYSNDDFGDTLFNIAATYDNYDNSLLAVDMNVAAISNLTKQEKEATLLSSVDNDEYTIPNLTYSFKDKFSNKQWFAPTAKIMTTPAYGFAGTGDASETRKQIGRVWLSSQTMDDADDNNSAGLLYTDGSVKGTSVLGRSYPARANTQLDSDSILMVSNAENGKQTNVIGQDALKPIVNSVHHKYKLTIKDEAQNLKIRYAKTDENNLMTVKYDKQGDGTTLSAVITDSTGETILSYGQVATLDAGDLKNQTVKVQLPANFYTDGYQVKLFTENYHADTQTDYASAFQTIKLISYNVSINYMDDAGVMQNKVYQDVYEGTDLSEDADFQAICEAPDGYRKATPFWTLTDGATDADLRNVTKNFSATGNYVKTWKVTFKTHDGKTWATSPWKDGPLYIDDGMDLEKDQIPEAPKRDSYTFTGWDHDMKKISKDTVIKPVYTKNPDELPIPKPDPNPNPTPNPIPNPDSDSEIEAPEEEMIKASSNDISFNTIAQTERSEHIANGESEKTQYSATTKIGMGKGNVDITLDNKLGIKDMNAFIKAVLTSEQIQRANAGETIAIRMNMVKLLDEEIGELNNITKKAKEKGITVGSYYDINIEVNDKNKWNVVSELQNTIELTFDIPKELQKGNKTFYTLKEHNGRVYVLSDQDNDEKTITIETYSFSTYAIGYREMLVENSYIGYLPWIVGVGLLAVFGGFTYYIKRRNLRK